MSRDGHGDPLACVGEGVKHPGRHQWLSSTTSARLTSIPPLENGVTPERNQSARCAAPFTRIGIGRTRCTVHCSTWACRALALTIATIGGRPTVFRFHITHAQFSIANGTEGAVSVFVGGVAKLRPRRCRTSQRWTIDDRANSIRANRPRISAELDGTQYETAVHAKPRRACGWMSSAKPGAAWFRFEYRRREFRSLVAMGDSDSKLFLMIDDLPSVLDEPTSTRGPFTGVNPQFGSVCYRFRSLRETDKRPDTQRGRRRVEFARGAHAADRLASMIADMTRSARENSGARPDRGFARGGSVAECGGPMNNNSAEKCFSVLSWFSNSGQL